MEVSILMWFCSHFGLCFGLVLTEPLPDIVLDLINVVLDTVLISDVTKRQTGI